MEYKDIVLLIMGEVSRFFNSLTKNDLEKLESGNFSIEFKIVKKENRKSARELLDKDGVDSLLDILGGCGDRELGYKILAEKNLTRKELEGFAKRINIHVMKQDSIDRIRDKIVEGVIGASIRSKVIQDYKT